MVASHGKLPSASSIGRQSALTLHPVSGASDEVVAKNFEKKEKPMVASHGKLPSAFPQKKLGR
jgi:hypothetical protein